MASAIHLTETSAFTSAKAAVICDVCRKHVDLPTECGNESTYESIDSGNFDCNICLDGCHDPVVTQCGHLFCWPCLYYWLSLHSLKYECPVCKANVQDKIVPLYGHGKAEHSMNSAAMMFPGMHIPCRPLPSTSGVPVFVTDHDGERNHAIQDYGIQSIFTGHAAPSASVRFFYGRNRNGASILTPRQRLSNEKEFVLHWAFIFVASIAIVCFIVY